MEGNLLPITGDTLLIDAKETVDLYFETGLAATADDYVALLHIEGIEKHRFGLP